MRRKPTRAMEDLMSSTPEPEVGDVKSASEPESGEDKSAKKFTIYIRPDLMKQLKIQAIIKDKTFSFLAQEAIEAYLKTS